MQLLGCSMLALAIAVPGNVFAQDQVATPAASQATPAAPARQAAAADTGFGDIVVTAQKREQSLNDVPLSISVASGEQLQSRGITDVAGLSKLVPGFTYTESAFATPVFTLRGVGFYDTSLAAKPSVSVYVDEVPLPFSVVTRGATLDLQRVEVLKGPQGTLFGQNSTGGAINYIAAKPTQDLEVGLTAGYERFGKFSAEGYLSGPISDTLSARLALRTEQGGAWQRSMTRPGDKIGDKNFTSGRFILDFKPSDSLRFELNLNGYIDKSEEVVAQYIALTPLANPARAGALGAAPRALGNARDADWTPSPRPKRDHWFYQGSLRADLDVAPDLTLTSLTAYSEYRHDQLIDPDGVALNDYFYHTTGRIKSFSQELRLGGKVGPDINFIVGANYSKEKTRQRDDNTFLDATSAYQFTDIFASMGVPGFPPFFGFADADTQNFTNKALFANVDYNIGSTVTLHGGVRYTDAKIDFNGCTLDDGNGTLALGYQTILNSIRGSLGLAPTTVPAGGCVSIDVAALQPAARVATLKENNVSWRAGIDYKPTRDLLLYASVSRGYKSGSFPLLAASDVAQFDPVVQESVTAYELGFKASVLDRTAQINGAVFYYDYRDKQLKGRSISSPDIFGPLERLFNVPKSSIKGAEIQMDLRPIRGFNVSIGATYIESKVRGSFNNIDSYGTPRDFGGSAFPYTPKFQVVLDGQYDWDMGNVRPFIGAGLNFQSDTIGALGSQYDYPYPELNSRGGLTIKDYTLIGLRAGLAMGDGRYRLTAYVNNLTNEYYWTNATRITDTTVRYAGMPRTYGLTISARY